jgi:WS/DGAT/MGAT family acyltransferase
LPLEDVKAIAKEADVEDVTINDVVVAACAGALRAYLLEHGALPDEPLTAMIPVSLRTGDEADAWSNRVSGTVASLPTDIATPRERLAVAHRALDTAKAVFALVPAGLAPDGAELGAPAVTTLISRATIWWSTHAMLPFNVVISNVPGPREPLYIGEARARHYFPVSAIVDGQGLNMTVQSYAGSVDVGLVSCARLIPDLPRLADLVIEEFESLRGAQS